MQIAYVVREARPLSSAFSFQVRLVSSPVCAFENTTLLAFSMVRYRSRGLQKDSDFRAPSDSRCRKRLVEAHAHSTNGISEVGRTDAVL